MTHVEKIRLQAAVQAMQAQGDNPHALSPTNCTLCHPALPLWLKLSVCLSLVADEGQAVAAAAAVEVQVE
jgi:adenylate cyclase